MPSHKNKRAKKSSIMHLFRCCTGPPIINVEGKEKQEGVSRGREDGRNKHQKSSPKKHIPKSMRIAVWNTYIGEEIGRTKCLVCRHVDITQMNFHCGHVIAEACGGKTCVENLRPICATCNLSMRTMNMNEFSEKYFHTSP